ncbi:MAG: carbohydrate ABC transporter permease [Thermomicrobiales bacterium]
MVSNGNSVLMESKASPDTAARKKPRRGNSSWLGYAFVAPNLIGFAIFTLLPLIFAFAVSFADWDVVSGLSGIKWVGLKNFSNLMTDAGFWQSARTTLIYVGVSVPITTAAGLLIALALNGPVPGRNILRLIFFIPFIVNAVAISATWILIYHPRYSPLNNTLRTLGIENPPLWLASSQWALPALIIMAIWGGCGFAAVIYLAALQDLPEDLFEAAELDGAGTIQKFRAITFPLITPTTFFLLVTGFIGASQSFGMINLMTRGGPGTSTTVASYYVYQNAFQFYKFGYAAAISWVMFAFVLLLMLVPWFVQRRAVVYE